MPQLSRRAQSLGTENAFVVLAEVTALAREGKDIISFCIGQPDFPAPVHVQEAAIRAIREGKHGYTPSAGIDPLREAAAKYMAGMRGGLPIRPEDVVIGAGAKPFIAYAILSTTDHGAGDEVIYPNPGFPIYESQIVACGAKPVPVHLKEERDFAFDPAELEKLITPKTRMLILNTPHNPTGGIHNRASLEQIARILQRHPQVWVYADEIYSRLCYTESFFSIAQLPGMYERTIISDGASKTWAMTGWRIGFASNPVLAPVLTRWITNTDSCASQISQWAALEAIDGPQDAADMMKKSFLERSPMPDGASKTWAMTGWRIGFASNPVLAPVLTRWITNTDSCASQISQWAAVEAINGPQDDAEKMKKSFLDRRDLIVGLLNAVPGVKCRTPGGAFYAWPNVTEACRMIGAADSEDFRKKLLNEAGVAVLADIHFGARVPGEGQHVRFSYAASNQAIEQGVARMADFIRRNTRKVA